MSSLHGVFLPAAGPGRGQGPEGAVEVVETQPESKTGVQFQPLADSKDLVTLLLGL